MRFLHWKPDINPLDFFATGRLSLASSEEAATSVQNERI